MARKVGEVRTKWVLFVLFGMGTLAMWAGSEAVLPAYIAGMVLATALGSDHLFVRRLRTLTIGFLAPLYFLRAGSFVSLAALVAAPAVFLLLLPAKSRRRSSGCIHSSSCFGGNDRNVGTTRS